MWGGSRESVFGKRIGSDHVELKEVKEDDSSGIVIQHNRNDSCRQFSRKHGYKIAAVLVLGLLAFVYRYGDEISGTKFKGSELWEYFVILLVAFSFYEIITLTQRLVIYLIKTNMKSGFWYLYFFISAFEAQMPFILWSIAVEDFAEWLLDLDNFGSDARDVLAKVVDCVIAICIGISLRNLLLRYLFWEVHQKKLSDRMQRFLEIEKVLQYLYDRFVIRKDNFLEANSYDGPEEGPEENVQQQVDEEDAIQTQIYSLTPIQVLKRMQEFDKRQKLLHSGNQVDLQLGSQNDAIEAGKSVFKKLDVEQKGIVPVKSIEKILSAKMNKTFYAEMKSYLQRMNTSDINSELSSDGNEDEKDEINDQLYLTEAGIVKAYIKLFQLGQGLTQVSSAWSELSSGLKALCDALLFAILSIICSILWGVNWTRLVVTIPTLLVSTAVAFGKALQRLVLSLAFIFVTKPYEVGDCIAIDKIEPLFFVESISVLTTQLRTVHNRKMMFPNWRMSELAVYNLSKNKVSKFDQFFELSFDTPELKLKKLRRDIAKFFKEHSDSYAPDFWFVTSDAHPGGALILQIRFGVKNAFENTVLTATRRSEFFLLFRESCINLGILYKPVVQPVQVVNK
jgi:hypothetical protein